MGGVRAPSAILVVSVAIPLHAMFICALIGNDCWGSLTGVRNGSVLTGGLAHGRNRVIGEHGGRQNRIDES